MNVVRFDPVTRKVVEFIGGVEDAADYANQSDWMVYPALPPGFPGERLDFWKVEGDSLVELSLSEKEALLAIAEDQEITEQKDGSKALFDDARTGRLLRAIVEEFVKAINVVRTDPQSALPAITASQVRTAIRNNIDGQS